MPSRRNLCKALFLSPPPPSPAVQNKGGEFAAPLTSFDWNELDPRRVGTASIDTTCTVWDVERGLVDTQLIAHDKEVGRAAVTSKQANKHTAWPLRRAVSRSQPPAAVCAVGLPCRPLNPPTRSLHTLPDPQT